MVASVTVEDFGTASEVTSDFDSIFIGVCTGIGEQNSLEVIRTSDIYDFFSQCRFCFCSISRSSKADLISLRFDSIYDFWQAVAQVCTY